MKLTWGTDYEGWGYKPKHNLIVRGWYFVVKSTTRLWERINDNT